MDSARYADDLAFVAQPRPPGSEHWARVQARCAERFEQYGYALERHQYGTGTNIVGVMQGASQERVIVSAHYDHIRGCEGADDNASGLAGLLEIARVLSTMRGERTLVVACWDEEERGLVGSLAYARRARSRAEPIVAQLVLEAIGYRSTRADSQKVPTGFGLLFPAQVDELDKRFNRGDFLAVIGDERSHAAMGVLSARAAEIALPVLGLEVGPNLRRLPVMVDLFRSDHAAFWEHGYPSMMLTDTADFRNPAYHCQQGRDTVDTIDTDFAVKVVRAATAAAHALVKAGGNAP